MDGTDVCSGKKVEDIVKNAGNKFNVQKRLINSQSLRRLNSSSINIFRVATYIWKNKIYHFQLILRIGQGGKLLDNAH